MNEKKKVFVRTGKMLLAAMMSLSAAATMLPVQPVFAQDNEFTAQADPASENGQKKLVEKTVTAPNITVAATDGDNKVQLDLPAAKSFTFSADVTFTSYDSETDEHSAALLFAGMAANVHEKIDWNKPLRLWNENGSGALQNEVTCPGENGEANTWLAENGISLADTFNLKVVVSEAEKSVTYFINNIEACKGTLTDQYQGGMFGLMTYKSDASFTNIQLTTLVEETEDQPDLSQKAELETLIAKVEELSEADYTPESWQALQEALLTATQAESDQEIADGLAALNQAIASLEKVSVPSTGNVSAADFVNIGAAGMTVDGDNLILDADGDHFAMLDTQKKAANDFRLEADVTLLEGTKKGDEGDQMSAALVFGASSKKTPGTKWYAANVDTRRRENDDFFRVFGAGRDILSGGNVSDVDTAKPIHLAIDVKADGSFTYTFGNAGQNSHEVSGTIENWEGGFAGLLTFCAKASFTNISFTDRTIPQQDQTLDPNENWNTNLGSSLIKGGSWSITEQGLVSDAQNQGDTFLIDQNSAKNFVYETDMKFESEGGAAGLIFRFDDEGEYGKEGYAVNVDAGSHKAKFWRWQNNDALQLIDEVEVEANAGRTMMLCS